MLCHGMSWKGIGMMCILLWWPGAGQGCHHEDGGKFANGMAVCNEGTDVKHYIVGIISARYCKPLSVMDITATDSCFMIT